jgi:hypothetical protein
MSLTAAERETTMTISDDAKEWIISSYRRADITKLKRNPNFKIESEGTFQGTAYISGRLPSNAITIRTGGGRTAVKSTNPANERLAGVKRCGHPKDNGGLCQMVAKKKTGKCRWHEPK